MAYVPNELLSRLIGKRLLSVEFILDYLVVRFDSDLDEPQAVLTCVVLPRVESASLGLLWDGTPGYTESLRSLIGHDVLSTDERRGIGLRIDFGAGVLVINPGLEELTGPEIALLAGFNDSRWMCWRPGEECFSDIE